jgi:hypothetical protein
LTIQQSRYLRLLSNKELALIMIIISSLNTTPWNVKMMVKMDMVHLCPNGP